ARLDRLERVAALDTSEGYRYDGYTSTSAFLTHRCGMGVKEAHRVVFLARALDQMAYSVKLVRTGDLSLSQFEVLAHGRSEHPEAFATDEAALAQSVVAAWIASINSGPLAGSRPSPQGSSLHPNVCSPIPRTYKTPPTIPTPLSAKSTDFSIAVIPCWSGWRWPQLRGNRRWLTRA
ncbi:MAG: DUF222 domain-containing protein, partial [Acidimicrobiia bacterium]